MSVVKPSEERVAAPLNTDQVTEISGKGVFAESYTVAVRSYESPTTSPDWAEVYDTW